MGKYYAVVSAICEYCGRMMIDRKYYEVNGKAVTHFIKCDKCLARGNNKKK